MSKILAIDPSTKSTGIAVFEDNKLVYVGCIQDEGSNVYTRIEKMVNGVRKIMIDYPDIKQVYMEDVLPTDVGNNREIYKKLMYLQGFLCDLFNEYHITPTFIFPSEWRSKCGIHTGRGVKRDSLKNQDMEFVRKVYGVDVNDDAADAVCIGHAVLKKETSGGFEFK